MEFLGKANTSTNINTGIWVPDADNNWSKVMDFGTRAEFNATTFGIGLLLLLVLEVGGLLLI